MHSPSPPTPPPPPHLVLRQHYLSAPSHSLRQFLILGLKSTIWKQCSGAVRLLNCNRPWLEVFFEGQKEAEKKPSKVFCITWTKNYHVINHLWQIEPYRLLIFNWRFLPYSSITMRAEEGRKGGRLRPANCYPLPLYIQLFTHVRGSPSCSSRSSTSNHV